jgi:hypothetical protein
MHALYYIGHIKTWTGSSIERLAIQVTCALDLKYRK